MNVFPNQSFPNLRSHLVLPLISQMCRTHLLECEICNIHNGILIVLEILSHEYCWFHCLSHRHAPNRRMFISVSCNIGISFLSFSHLIVHPIHEWSWFYRQLQFCFFVSHEEILRSCHFLRIDIIRSPRSATRCFFVPYGLRGSVEKNFLVIRSNFSYHSPNSFIRSPWSIARRSFSFPLLRRPITVVIQFWITCWREAFHELLMEVMVRGFK